MSKNKTEIITNKILKGAQSKIKKEMSPIEVFNTVLKEVQKEIPFKPHSESWSNPFQCPIKNERVPCPICNVKTPSSSRIGKWKVTVCNKKIAFKCPFCKFTFCISRICPCGKSIIVSVGEGKRTFDVLKFKEKLERKHLE